MDPPSSLFEQLLRQVGKTRRLARSLLGDESAADDAIQETWASASRQAPPEIPGPWLGTALRNRLLNRARDERRRTAREEKASAEPVSTSPEDLLARLEIHKKLVEAVARLAEPYRQTVLLSYFEELSSAEIGARLNVPAATVRGRLKTAVELLRQDLDRRPGGRKAWVGALVLLAGQGGRIGIETVGAASQAAVGGSTQLLLKVIVAVTVAGGAGTALVALKTPRTAPVQVVKMAARPVRFDRSVLREEPPAVPAAAVVPATIVPPTATPTPTPTGAAAEAAAPVFSFAGWVQVAEKQPQPARINVGGDPSCSLQQRDETVLMDIDGGLRNAVVRVVSPVPAVAPPPASPLVIEQGSCQYQPRIAVAQTGQTVQLRTRDQVLHRPHVFAAGDSVLTGVLSMGTPPLDVTAPKAGETMRIGCDLHAWMTATVVSTDNPWFAVSSWGGRYRISGLPAGSYAVEVWHERFGTQRTQVTVAPGQPPPIVNFTFGTVAAQAGDGCRIASRKDAPVLTACQEGGIKRAKAVMKAMVRQAKENRLRFECDDCHRDESAGSWTLTPGAARRFEQLLRAARELRDSPRPR